MLTSSAAALAAADARSAEAIAARAFSKTSLDEFDLVVSLTNDGSVPLGPYEGMWLTGLGG